MINYNTDIREGLNDTKQETNTANHLSATDKDASSIIWLKILLQLMLPVVSAYLFYLS